MCMQILKISLGLVIAAVTLTAGAQQSDVAPIHTYTYEERGFEGGGVLFGSLTGHDLNGDGLISSRENELLSYSLTFKAGSLGHDIATGLTPGLGTSEMLVTVDVQSGTVVEPDQEGFFFSNSVFLFGTGNSQIALPNGGGFKTVFGAAFFIDGSHLSITSAEPLVLSSVPEISTYAMTAIGLTAIASLVLNSRRQRKQFERSGG